MDDLLSGRPMRHERAGIPAAVRESLATYLDGWGWNDTLRTEALIDACLRRVGERIGTGTPLAQAEAALDALERELEAWAVFVLGQERLAGRPPLLVARLAFRASGGPARWPECFLSYDPPAAFVEAMGQAVPSPVPVESPSSMREQPFEVWGLSDLVPARLTGRRPAMLSIRS